MCEKYVELTEPDLIDTVEWYYADYGDQAGDPKNLLDVLKTGMKMREDGGVPRYFLIIEEKKLLLLVIEEKELMTEGKEKIKEYFA